MGRPVKLWWVVVMLSQAIPPAVAQEVERSPRPVERPKPKMPVEAVAAAEAPVVLFSGQDVFAATEIRCGPQADVLRGYWAEVVATEPDLELRLREHLSVMANHGLTDAAGQPDLTSEFWGDTWCIPQRAWCYGAVAPDAFGATLKPGEVYPWAGTLVAPVEAGFVTAFARLRDAECLTLPQPVPAYAPPFFGPQ